MSTTKKVIIEVETYNMYNASGSSEPIGTSTVTTYVYK